MRLTLRTMLAYLDDVLTEADSHELGQKIDSSDFATGLVHRIRNSISQLRLSSPELLGSDSMDDPNTVSEFIDSALSPEKEQEFEKICLQSDKHLAEVASSHQILTMVLGTPARVSPRLRDRVYRTGIPGEGAELPLPTSSGRRGAFHRADHSGSDVGGTDRRVDQRAKVTDAALAIEDEAPIEIRRPRAVSDSRATLAEFSQGRNLWPIAAALLLGFLLTGGFLFAMGPLNSSHPLAGLLGLRDVQVAENADVPEASLTDQLETPDVVVPASDVATVDAPALQPTAPAAQFQQPSESVDPNAIAQTNAGAWEVPEQANAELANNGVTQVPEFDQIPDFPPVNSDLTAPTEPLVAPPELTDDSGVFFGADSRSEELAETRVDNFAADAGEPIDALSPDPVATDPAATDPVTTERLQDIPPIAEDLRDPSARLSDDPIGFDELVAEDAPPMPEREIPGFTVPDPNTLADSAPVNQDPLDQGFADDPLVADSAVEGGQSELLSDGNVITENVDAEGTVDLSADSDPVAEAVVAEPEAPIEMGQFLSEDQVLLYWDEQTAAWTRLAPRMVFGVGHRLRMLENFRTQLLLSSANMLFASRGDTDITFADPIDGQIPTLEVPFGRFLLTSAGQGESRFALQTGDRTIVVEFSEPNTEVICQVRPVLLPGTDPRREPRHRMVQLWVTLGSAKIMEGDREEQIDMGQQYAFADDVEARIVSFRKVPGWVVNRIDPVDRDASLELEPLLPLGRDVLLSLTEAADSRRTDVRFWAMRDLVSLGEYRTGASLFSVADRKHQYAWPALFDEFRAVVARGGESAAGVQKTFADLYGAEGAKLYRMLLGFDNDQLKAGAADQLVEDLDHPRVEFRILAIQNLKRITGKTLTYSPVLGEKFRATKVTRWKNELKQGKVLISKPSNGVLSSGQLDLADWNSLTEPVLP